MEIWQENLTVQSESDWWLFPSSIFKHFPTVSMLTIWKKKKICLSWLFSFLPPLWASSLKCIYQTEKMIKRATTVPQICCVTQHLSWELVCSFCRSSSRLSEQAQVPWRRRHSLFAGLRCGLLPWRNMDVVWRARCLPTVGCRTEHSERGLDQIQ